MEDEVSPFDKSVDATVDALIARLSICDVDITTTRNNEGKLYPLRADYIEIVKERFLYSYDV